MGVFGTSGSRDETLIVITHDLSLARRASRVIEIQDAGS